MRTSESTSKLTAALVAVQKALGPLERNREVAVQTKAGGRYTFRYTTLDHLIEHLRQPCLANGLWFTQSGENGLLTTRLMHISGEWQETTIPATWRDTLSEQELGTALTYRKRYGLAAAFGLASEEDDDGNHASGNVAKEQLKPQQVKAKPTPAPRREAPLAAAPTGDTTTVEVVRVKTGEKRDGSSYTRYSVKFATGAWASTFSDTLGTAAQDAEASGAFVIPEFEQKGEYLNLVGLVRANAEQSESEQFDLEGSTLTDENLRDDDVPF